MMKTNPKKMDLLKTPSVQSLLDSDLESVGSLQYLDIDELDEFEYGLPSSDVEIPSLAEVLSADDDLDAVVGVKPQLHQQNSIQASACSVLQTDFLQAVSQQLLQAQERSSSGVATTLSIGKDGRITVGTAHGHLLSFYEQILRWVCNADTDGGAVSCLAYNSDSTRLLAGYARGLVCQYESIRGIVLRRVTLGCDIWGTLKITWAGVSALALDTGGSVWLIKFLRPLGVRSARISCLFSGARGEVVTMSARDAHVLALATLSRVIIVAGGRAVGTRLKGPPETLPVLEWCHNNDQVLVCARANTLQWLSVTITGHSIDIQTLQRFELKSTALWLGWLGDSLAIFDVDENLRIWGEDYDKPLDLSHIEPIYASAFFKGFWTEGRVSRAMVAAGGSALGGACAAGGVLLVLGRKGVLSVRPRDVTARASSFFSAGQHLEALRLLCSAKKSDTKTLAQRCINFISEKPQILEDKRVADLTVKLCLKHKLSEELWTTLWEQCSHVKEFVESTGDAIVRGEFDAMLPSPDCTQALLERLADCEPGLVERVVTSLPLRALDPHRATVLARSRRMWRALAAIAAALGGTSEAVSALVPHVVAGCVGVAGGAGGCGCAGEALVLVAADALAGRAPGGLPLPPHDRPSAAHHALQNLLADQWCYFVRFYELHGFPGVIGCIDGTHVSVIRPQEHEEAYFNRKHYHSLNVLIEASVEGGTRMSPLGALVRHSAGAAVRLLEQSARDPPFAGPLAKHNRARVAKALLAVAPQLQKPEDRVEILEYISGQLNSSALPADPEVIKSVQEVAATTAGERADRAWLSAAAAGRAPALALADARQRALHPPRPRVLWRIDAQQLAHDDALRHFFMIDEPSEADLDEFFDYIQKLPDADVDSLRPYLTRLAELRPAAAAALLPDRLADEVPTILQSVQDPNVLTFGERLLEMGKLSGDALTAHFRNLCTLKPSSVPDFLTTNPGVLRPEDALTIVREAKLTNAEPMCLEAMGDADGALDGILRILSTVEEIDEESRLELVERACGVCARASAACPAGAAGRLWARLLRCAAARRLRTPALLLHALAHLPVDETITMACDTPSGALTVLECAAEQVREWACAASVARRERHRALAAAWRAARRALAVRNACARCGLPLLQAETGAVRTGHCGRAFHAWCSAEGRCGLCGGAAPAAACASPPRPRRLAPSRLTDQALLLIPPPRPDLEGVF